ncbi:MAG: tryptophan 7-halogenase [Albidovulum sp.]|uniref:NAD(P)/FAD-dependent oxidoreductase n=1 Tax=Albidovulum sp. TaxID=1872424 RepID=UPI003CB977A0
MTKTDIGLDDVFDVVVVGAGAIGLTYANWLKKMKPDTRILVLEAQAAPKYKIGESTLSSAIRCLHDLGFAYPAMRRLFHTKEGLSYWWTGPGRSEISDHVDVLGLDETFQFDRRVFETAFIELSRRNSVPVIQGAQVRVHASDLDSEIKTIVYTHDGEAKQVQSKMICDATGPAQLIARAKKVEDRKLDDFNTNSYYGYFRVKNREIGVKHWNRPMTRHICFEEGWLWFINIDSWDNTDDATLQNVVNELLDTGSDNEADYPSRKALIEKHNADIHRTVSIGFVVRRDRLPNERMNSAEAFAYFREKYPAIDDVLSNFEFIGDAKDPSAYEQRNNVARCREQFAGSGWIAVGEAAMLVDPFFSTGMNYGVGNAFMAARQTARALELGRHNDATVFNEYQRYCRTIFDALYREVGVYYRAFARKDTFESVLLSKISFALTEIVNKVGYTMEDLYVWDLLNPTWLNLIDEVGHILRKAEAQNTPDEKVIADVKNACDTLQNMLTTHPSFQHIKFAGYFNEFNARLERDAMHVREETDISVFACDSCTTWFTVVGDVASCPHCAHPVSHSEGHKVPRMEVA